MRSSSPPTRLGYALYPPPRHSIHAHSSSCREIALAPHCRPVLPMRSTVRIDCNDERWLCMACRVPRTGWSCTRARASAHACTRMERRSQATLALPNIVRLPPSRQCLRTGTPPPSANTDGAILHASVLRTSLASDFRITEKCRVAPLPSMPAHGGTATVCEHGRDNPTFSVMRKSLAGDFRITEILRSMRKSLACKRRALHAISYPCTSLQSRRAMTAHRNLTVVRALLADLLRAFRRLADV